MTTLTIIGDVACFAAGGAIVWLFKERIQSIWTDANTLAAKLRAKADAISQAAKR